jgi:hypothetical protein
MTLRLCVLATSLLLGAGDQPREGVHPDGVPAFAEPGTAFAAGSSYAFHSLALGDVNVLERFHLAEGRILEIDRDATLLCEGPIEIDGTLVATGPGTRLRLESRTRITIDGMVLAGPGSGGRPDGGDVVLVAPEVWIDGLVRAGDGARGKPGQAGGDGGSVQIHGSFWCHDPITSIGSRGGDGGVGGDASWASTRAPGKTADRADAAETRSCSPIPAPSLPRSPRASPRFTPRAARWPSGTTEQPEATEEPDCRAPAGPVPLPILRLAALRE